MLDILFQDNWFPQFDNNPGNSCLNTHVDHVLESLVQVVANFLNFQLFGEQVFLDLINQCIYDNDNDHFMIMLIFILIMMNIFKNLVNPDIEPLNVHLCVLAPVDGIDGFVFSYLRLLPHSQTCSHWLSASEVAQGSQTANSFG